MSNLLQLKAIEATAHRLLDFFGDIEAKASGVRHVRTPEGARRYNLPIGAVIVGDDLMTNIQWRRTTDDGYDVWVGGINDPNTGRSAEFRAAKDSANNEWFALDSDGFEVAVSKNESDFYRQLNEYAAHADKDNVLTAEEDRGKRKAPPGFRPVTGEERLPHERVMGPDGKPLKENGKIKIKYRAGENKDRVLNIPPFWVDVFVNKDPNGEPMAIGYDAADRKQSLYSGKHSMKQSAVKQQRNKSLGRYITKLDRALKSDWKNDPVAQACLLIYKTGMRPGSTSDTRSKVQAFGATTLEARHVTINKDSVSLHFTGKSGKEIKLLLKDPEVVAMFRIAKGTKTNRQRIFPDVTREAVSQYMDQYIPKQFKVKDLRTYKANVVALAEIKKIKKMPTTRAEFVRYRNAIGDTVSAQLGNTRTMALKSYINPTVFDAISTDPAWSAEFAKSITGSSDDDE